MAWSINDLSSVTDVLTSQLDAAIVASPIYGGVDPNIKTSGLMPFESREESTPQLNLYLLHVSRDAYWRNTPTSGQRGQLNAVQPLSLNLSYILTAYAKGNYHAEQQLMSIALAWFHNNPIYQTSFVEWTVTVEADSIEEMSRLWQAITAPIRLSAMFRVAVIFLAPQTPQKPDNIPPVEVNLSVGAGLGAAPTSTTASIQPQLSQVAIQTTYSVPPDATALDQVTVIPTQPVVIAGDMVRIRGGGLDLPEAAAIYLTDPVSGDEWPITSWRSVPPAGTAVSPDELVLTMPKKYGPLLTPGNPLTATPTPAVFQLKAGVVGPGFRTSAVPLAIAPFVEGVTHPAELLPVGTTYTFTVQGFVAGQTSVLLGTTALTEGPLAPGFFTLSLIDGSISFQAPPTPAGASGTYVRVRVLVNSVEAPPGWWVLLP